jgi:hypothetical protein
MNAQKVIKKGSMNSEQLIQKLLEDIKQTINHAEKLKHYDLNALAWRENSSSWNMLECLEHLNLYGEFYLPLIKHKIKTSNTTHDVEFKSGRLGNYFAQSMLPKEKLNKMKTFKDKNPLNSTLDKSVIDKFISQQIELLDLLNQSRGVSLNKIKIETSISRLIKIKLGDTFQFLINHIIRHLKQIEVIEQKITPITKML